VWRRGVTNPASRGARQSLEFISEKGVSGFDTYPNEPFSNDSLIPMAKGTPQLEWCVVRLGEDHNWWVDGVSDPVHWDVDGLSIIDPRQVDHLIEAIEPLREYGFDPDVFERAFIAFRISKDMGKGRVRLQRTKEALMESDEKLFALPDIIDEENGPYADLLDHLTRLRVKLLNDLFDFEEKLTVDEVEDQIRETQNNDFIEGKSVHLFSELTSILDFMPAGYGDDDEEEVGPAPKRRRAGESEEEDDLPEIEEEEDERMKNDASLKWDEDEEEKKEGDEEPKKGGADDDDDGEEKDFDDDDDEDEDEDDDEEESEDEDSPKSRRGRR
jgi:hypothetical protein